MFNQSNEEIDSARKWYEKGIGPVMNIHFRIVQFFLSQNAVWIIYWFYCAINCENNNSCIIAKSSNDSMLTLQHLQRNHNTFCEQSVITFYQILSFFHKLKKLFLISIIVSGQSSMMNKNMRCHSIWKFQSLTFWLLLFLRGIIRTIEMPIVRR